MLEIKYRSLELDTGNIVEGYYAKEHGYAMRDDKPLLDEPCIRHFIFDGSGQRFEITPEYLSVNFNDSEDGKGTKIFASLYENGNGGDILLSPDGITKYKVLQDKNGVFMTKIDRLLPRPIDPEFEVVGIFS